MLNKSKILFNKFKCYNRKNFILGIETSCDDTGVAIIDLQGNVKSEYVNSQIKISSNIGGIIPTVAQQLHLHNLDPTVKLVMDKINLTFKDLTAIALTVKPGLPLSLMVGKNYAVAKAKEHNLPIIPIHHMEAHALTVRLFDRSVGFPFMVLLISGGNCLLGLAHDVENFSMLGNQLDSSPGHSLDKIARLFNLIGVSGSYNHLSGGRAIEKLAEENVDKLIPFDACRLKHRDCNFSFSGLEGAVHDYLIGRENRLNLPQLCASVLYNMASQMCSRLTRAMMYCQRYIDNCPKILVVSGGVASNLFFRSCFQRICNEYEYRLVCPPIEYCTDNGAMIAWNGYELYQLNKRIVYDLDIIDFCGKTPFGVDRSPEILCRSIKAAKIKLTDLFIK